MTNGFLQGKIMVKAIIIIAEAGVNYNGNIEIAKKLIDSAERDRESRLYKKFQSFITDDVVSKIAPKAEYQLNLNNTETQYEMLKKLELTEKTRPLDITQQNVALSFFDLNSIELLISMNFDLYKIPSGELTNLPYLKIGSLNKSILLSTGMANLGEIEKLEYS